MLITCNPTPITRTGGFTVAMFEILTKLVCLIWKFSRGGWRTTFLPDNTEWRTNGYRLCLSIKNAHFKEFWILILQYNNSLRHPGKGMQKSKQNRNVKAKNRESNRTVIITINPSLETQGLLAGTICDIFGKTYFKSWSKHSPENIAIVPASSPWVTEDPNPCQDRTQLASRITRALQVT